MGGDGSSAFAGAMALGGSAQGGEGGEASDTFGVCFLP